MKNFRPFIVLVVTASSVMFGSCRQPVEPEVVERPAMVVENMELRLRLAGVPGGFMVVMNDGDQLILEPSDSTTEGQVHFANNPPEAGQNLPAEVKAHQVFIENQEESDYLGGQELISQLGTSFYSRGRYVREGSEIEETIIYALHPYKDRIMTITYRYPVGDDSSVRVQQLFDVLAIVEGMD
jgi:hypothetical protein